MTLVFNYTIIHDYACSGKSPMIPASEASQMPRSVIKPVTSLAGVTSNP